MKAMGKSSMSSALKVILDIVWYIMLLALAALVVATLCSMVKPSVMRVDLLLPFEIDESVYEIGCPDLGVGTAIITEAFGKLVFRGDSRAVVLSFFGAVATYLVASLLVVLLLRRIFRTLVAGDPFVRVNAARIRWIGLIVILSELYETLVIYATAFYLRGNFTLDGIVVRLDYRPELTVIFVGGVLLVLAEVFRLGAELREEHVLTV